MVGVHTQTHVVILHDYWTRHRQNMAIIFLTSNEMPSDYFSIRADGSYGAARGRLGQ